MGWGGGCEVWVGQKRASGVGARVCLGCPWGSASPLADARQVLGPEDCPYQPLLGTIKRGYGALRTASRHEFEGPTLHEPNMVGKVDWEDPIPCSAEKGHRGVLLAPSSPTWELKMGELSRRRDQ